MAAAVPAWRSPDLPIRIGISSCLLGEAVRYDGGHQRDAYLTGVLGRHVTWVPVCPEMEVGLGVPREPIRLVGDAAAPRLLGVDPKEMLQVRPFTFGSAIEKTRGAEAWRLLDRPDEDGVVPAIGDENTVVWGLGRKVGDTLPYTDDQGNTFQLRIVGTLANTILQGALVISERHFIERFPSAAGYQVFLIDAPRETLPEVSATLADAMEDIGADITPAPERLAAFAAVTNGSTASRPR